MGDQRRDVRRGAAALAAVVAAAVVGLAGPARGEGATCVGNSCDATYLAATTLDQANAYSGVAVSAAGNTTGVVAVSALFGNATAHSYSPISGLTIPGVAVSTTGHAHGDVSVTVTGTAD